MSVTKKIDPLSASACPSSLDFFRVPPTQTAINKTQLREILPLNSSNESPYDFRIFSDSQYIDLQHCYLYLKLSIEKYQDDVWGPLENNDEVGFVNMIGHAFVRQMRVSIGSNEIYDSGNLNAYLSYIKHELHTSMDYKKTVLSSIGYFPDEPNQNRADNPGHVQRMALAHEGRTFECFTPLSFDLSEQPQLLLNNLDLLFTIYKNDDAFLVKCFTPNVDTPFRIRVHSIKMYVKAVDVQPSVNMAVMRTLEKTPAKYALNKYQIRSTFLSQGRIEISQTMFSNIIPKRLIIAFVDSQAYNGDIARQPFNFLPYSFRDAIINAGGCNFPLINYNANFNNANDRTLMRLFVQMHESCNAGAQTTNGINLEKFTNGWTFFVVNLNSSLNEGDGFALIREGVTNVRIQFSEPLPNPVMMICVAEFDGLLMIDRNRIAVADGSV